MRGKSRGGDTKASRARRPLVQAKALEATSAQRAEEADETSSPAAVVELNPTPRVPVDQCLESGLTKLSSLLKAKRTFLHPGNGLCAGACMPARACLRARLLTTDAAPGDTRAQITRAQISHANRRAAVRAPVPTRTRSA